MITKTKLTSAYIFGAGRLGVAIKKVLSKNDVIVLGIVDNHSNEALRLREIEDKSASVVVASINYMYEIENQLKNEGFCNIIKFPELIELFPELKTYNQAFNNLREDYYENKSEYDNLYNILEDEKSKTVLSTIIEYRKSYNTELYATICDDINVQYFEDFMPKNIGTFIYGGAFDGDTVQRCFKNGFRPKKIYFFEPDKISLRKAKFLLKNISGIEYIPFGLSDSKKVLKFDMRGDLGSLFSPEGDIEIQCVALNDVVKEDIAFIKLDIEGAEIDAIKGATRLFKNGSPFAICVYHKPSDIWQIPKLIKSINPNYKFYLRHYTTSIFETVLYGVI